MVYINSGGDIGEKTLASSAADYFWKIIYFFMFFFQALINPLLGRSGSYDEDSQARFRATLRGGGGGGGGGGPNGGRGDGPWRPGDFRRRPMGRLNTLGPSNMPSCPSGGCCR